MYTHIIWFLHDLPPIGHNLCHPHILTDSTFQTPERRILGTCHSKQSYYTAQAELQMVFLSFLLVLLDSS